MVERMSKNGLRRFDVRSAVLSLAEQAPPEVPEVTDGNSTAMGERALRSAILEAVIRHGSPSVRPDDLLAALRIEGLASRAIVTRLAQGPFDERAGAVTDPFGPDRK